MKKKIIYKIQRDSDGLFWVYGNKFSDMGKSINNMQSVQSCLSQLTYQYDDLFGRSNYVEWTDKVQVVEYELVPHEIQRLGTVVALQKKMLFIRSLSKTYGDLFQTQFKQMVLGYNSKQYLYAINIQSEVYSEFIIQLKELGFSSRKFKKTKQWLWIDDAEVALNIRLMASVNCVNLMEMVAEYTALANE